MVCNGFRFALKGVLPAVSHVSRVYLAGVFFYQTVFFWVSGRQIQVLLCWRRPGVRVFRCFFHLKIFASSDQKSFPVGLALPCFFILLEIHGFQKAPQVGCFFFHPLPRNLSRSHVLSSTC